MAALWQPGMASARNVTAQEPTSVSEALIYAGYRAQLDKDSGGDPMIRSASSGTSFSVFFNNCTDNTDCRTIQFFSSYENVPNGTVEAINNWNAKWRFGRAVVEDGVARLEMDVDLDDGGMSTLLFEDNLEYWVAIMSEFEKHIGY